ncbi:MAG TPA: DinB family protein [Pyrinomonadaceae bacterium]|nr:DinB family protein [Pyrinomonadaceae bacterium]
MTMGPVLHSFAYCLDYLRDQVEGVAAADMVAQPDGIMNHPAWVIGHLTHTCQMLGGVIGLPEWLPTDWAARYGTGGTPAADAGLYETKDDALAILRDAQVRLTEAVGQVDDDRLDEPFPDEAYLVVFPTVRHALTQVLVGHTANHVGQVSVWRRAMGLPPMGRAFE